MPKIIENLRDRLLTEVKTQLEQGGYESVTVRSIAKACGVGLGTVYNYFPSKDALIASLLLEDWNRCMDEIRAAAERSAEPRPVLQCMYGELVGFSSRHKAVFQSKAAVAGFAAVSGQYHGVLLARLAEPLKKYCRDDFAALFVAESMLTWSQAGKTFDEIYETLKNPI